MADPNDADLRLGLFQVFLERHEWVTSADLLRSLTEAGLHVVTDADHRVLDAMAGIEIKVLEAIRDKWSCAPLIFHPPCLAELARRGEAMEP